MTKTILTKKLELAVFEYFDKPNASICIEVKIGNLTSERLITEKTEIVDAMVYETDSTIRCVEIKSSLSDFKSSSSLSFYGEYNYLAIPVELLDRMKNEERFKDYCWSGIGVLTMDNRGKFSVYRKPKKKSIGLGLKNVLLESMLRSASRDAKKHYLTKI